MGISSSFAFLHLLEEDVESFVKRKSVFLETDLTIFMPAFLNFSSMRLLFSDNVPVIQMD